MNTYNGPTPYKEDLDRARIMAPGSAHRHVLEGLDVAYRRGWQDAKAEDAPLLEALEAIENIFDLSELPSTHPAVVVEQLWDMRPMLQAAIAQARKGETYN